MGYFPDIFQGFKGIMSPTSVAPATALTTTPPTATTTAPAATPATPASVAALQKLGRALYNKQALTSAGPPKPAPTPTTGTAINNPETVAYNARMANSNWTPPKVAGGMTSKQAYAALGLKKGGEASSKKAKSSSKPTPKSASKRGDGIAQRGKTRGKMV